MPPLPGEDRILTVFVDVHCYFSAPTRRPSRHRFDKGSYLYIYHDAAQHKTRIEVANNPGTPDQDAFYGALDPVHLRHSIRFPTLCTLTIGGQAASPESFPPPPNSNLYEWRLPTNDPRDEGNDLHRIHTVDIYFWTLNDANSFLDSVERVLSKSHIESDRHYAPSGSDNAMSTVVQQLEDVAVTDPAYQDGHTRNSRTEPVQSTAPEPQNATATSALPPPPPGGPPPTAQSVIGAQPDAEQKQAAPLPYNPAAPAAPEPIQHREKTPPPVDADNGTGLAEAAVADHNVQYAQQAQGSTSFASPPTRPVSYSAAGSMSMPGSYASPPPSAGLPYSAASPAPRPPPVQSPPGVPVPSYQPPFTPVTAQQINQPRPTSSFAPPPRDANANPYAQNIYAQPHPQPQPQTAAPGYPNLGPYHHQQTPSPYAQTSDYDIHNQAYRPSDAEANSHYQKYAQDAMRNRGQRPRKLEEGASRVESGVNRFLKKLEKSV
ncbi:hypothetical protein PHISP_06828 [Aspergillus sp. HF37]|nr:hypothetical protein PHISP_06828 [Aspergillus sp. HF37]